MPSSLPWEQIAPILVAALAGALVQGSIGFGFSFVMVPVLTIIEPAALPTTILLMAVPMTIFMAVRERGSLDRRGFAFATVGRVFGTAGGLLLLAAVPEQDLAVLMGAVILIAVASSLLTPDFEARTLSHITAGVASGVMGTAAALGGPPMALAYQSRPAPELRSTLAAAFVVGGFMSLGGLIFTGQAHTWQLMLALELLPGLAAGLYLSKHVIRSLDRDRTRLAVLVFAGAAGLWTVVNGLLA
jgi:uncharacterized protein